MEGKTPPAQVAQCQDHLGHKSVGAVWSNQMQLVPPQCKTFPSATCIWLLHPAPIDLYPRCISVTLAQEDPMFLYVSACTIHPDASVDSAPHLAQQ